MAQIAQQDNSAMHVLLVGWLTQPGIRQNTQLILLTQTAAK